ncbi:hydantoinase/oxoprolinase family protein [Microbaculum marinisediminis]|uniref:Hydantoinase/oxoprolinase family protein n=1 Tax=Microbaculum marinisediminis TaxID=2931392 RepID=A0AAW5R4K8_9HYPH|nr:hydantoinase/oxoprolinase family protein [Microbaculum sp. A6E488]MCT8974320.1 hydantoinase/oxoprolinase family protein [Microbaculum sp. A6E488]
MDNQQNPVARKAPAKPWRIGVDIGGTFTDMILVDAAGDMFVFKEPSVPSNPAEGVLATLASAERYFRFGQSEILAGCDLFIHGSTVATNTVLEHKGAKVGLITTEGFRDSLEIRRGIRFHQWDHRAPYPEVLVPRYLRRPVAGRIDSKGGERIPLDREALARALDELAGDGVESLAVALLNAYVNPVHEKAAAEVVAEKGGFDWLSVSTDIAPILGEYERTSTTVLNAYIAPRVVTYLETLNEALQNRGLRRPLLLVQSNGGMVSVDQVTDRPVNLVLSGPAAGVGALNLISETSGDNLISMEIGGTSCDVMMLVGGHVAVGDELIIDEYHVSIPSIEVHTVGAGGGTIASVDAAGMLVVGPQGAGANPGPACYGLGGTEPTATDAQLVLGRLAAGPIGGEGSIVLDAQKAHQVVESKIAKPLGLDKTSAAAGIVRLLEQHLLHAVERISTERGYDPKNFTLVAAGGAGPLHGASVGRMIGCKSVCIPRLAGAFCALGMLHSNLRQDFFQVLYPVRLEDAGPLIAKIFTELGHKAIAALARQGFEESAVVLKSEADLRYQGQLSSVRIAFDPEAFDTAQVRASFEGEYRRQFGHTQPEGAIEITALRVAGIGTIPPLMPAARTAATGKPKPLEVRDVYINDEEMWQPTPVYDGRDLTPGVRLSGPLIVREPTTTVLVSGRDRLFVDAADNFVIELN